MPPKKNFICSRCKLACRDNHDLQKHLDKKKKCVPVETHVEPAAEPKRWHCEPCKSTFSSLGNYNAHLNTKSHKRITSTDITTLTGSGPPPQTEGLNGQTGEEDEEAEPPVQYIAGPCTSSTEPVDIAGPSNSFDEPAGESEGGVNCVLKTLNTSKIRKTDEKPPRVAVLDLISVLTNQTISNSSVTFSRLCQKFPEVKDITTYHKFKGRGQKLVPVIPNTVTCIDFVLKAVVPGMRIPIAKKRVLLQMQEPLRKFTEIEIHSQIIRALGHFSCVPQYYVGRYRLDLYFPGEKLAVECDENNHVNYNETQEKERYDTITCQLGCTWIRYDPYNPRFDVFDLINQILQHLMVSYTMRT